MWKDYGKCKERMVKGERMGKDESEGQAVLKRMRRADLMQTVRLVQS